MRACPLTLAFAVGSSCSPVWPARAGIEYRDAEYLGFGCGELCAYSLLAGVSLSEIGSNIERYAVLVRKFRNELSTTYIGLVQQAVLCLLGRASDPTELDGEAFTISDYHMCREKGCKLQPPVAARQACADSLLASPQMHSPSSSSTCSV